MIRVVGYLLRALLHALLLAVHIAHSMIPSRVGGRRGSVKILEKFTEVKGVLVYR